MGFHPSATTKSGIYVTTSLLNEVYSDVGVEPALQPVEGEPMQFATANRLY